MYDEELLAHVEEVRQLSLSMVEGFGDGSVVLTPEAIEMGRSPDSYSRVEAAFDRTISGPEGPLRLRIMVPAGELKGVYLHLHGGGFTTGAPEMDDEENWAIATTAGVAVVSVDYRLAPEHPFPAGPDDAEAAAVWLLDCATAEFGTDALCIGGSSAGANLSAITLLRVRDRHDAVERFRAANLAYGGFDMSGTPSARLADPRTPLLTPLMTRTFRDHYLPGRGGDERRRPAVSPLYADLRGMPPALFTVGSADPYLDDSLFMSRRWEAAGNETRLDLYPDAPHGFTILPCAMREIARRRMAGFLSEALA